VSSTTNYEDIMSSCIIEEEDIVEPLTGMSSGENPNRRSFVGAYKSMSGSGLLDRGFSLPEAT
jgi:hypothetical protein